MSQSAVSTRKKSSDHGSRGAGARQAAGHMPVSSRREDSMTFEDLRESHDEVRRIHEIVTLSLMQPELIARLGCSLPRGILIYGPQGTGKTLAVKLIADKAGAKLYCLDWSHIMAIGDEESLDLLLCTIREAADNGPSIVLIDDIESMGYDQGWVTGLVRKKSSQLIHALDLLDDDTPVMVIAITDKLSTIDPNLKKHRRLGARVEFRAPDEAGRRDILKLHTRAMPLDNVNLDLLAHVTTGFVGADIAALCREAAMCALHRALPETGGRFTPRLEPDGDIRVTDADFQAALRILGKK